MNENNKRYYLGKKPDGTKELVWNWPQNINSDVYPEYVSWEGPFENKVEAQKELQP